jgi:hypothetical protein
MEFKDDVNKISSCHVECFKTLIFYVADILPSPHKQAWETCEHIEVSLIVTHFDPALISTGCLS